MRREKGYHLLDMEDKTPKEAEMCKTALDKSRELEAKYEQEDEEMMIRLIKIRQSLWT
jgi:aspartate/tyrosine/aromatic aminotransferase